MRKFQVLIKFVLILLVVGCQTTDRFVNTSQPVLQDKVFSDFTSYEIETEKQIFSLNDEAKAFVKKSKKGLFKPQEQIEKLVHNIFSHSNFNLLYRAEANTTASQTFSERAANCLSMSIMTYAMALEAGFGVRFQDVEIPEYWTRREGHSLLNRHINLQILPKPHREQVRFITKGYEVDFDAQATRKHFPKTFVSKQQVVAMYYNNKGADALLSNEYHKAYAYFRAAIKLEPELPSVLANLGFLYRNAGYHDYAENAYMHALQIDQNNLTAWKNLAYLYRHTGRIDDATTISTRIEAKRANNPFYHINLGDYEYEQENWQQALAHYRQALKLEKSYHEVFFGLGKTYFKLGNVSRSQYYLKLAKKKARTQEEENIYQSKLELLSRL
jgi:tetratricopeptide (TPR) repeat protein